MKTNPDKNLTQALNELIADKSGSWNVNRITEEISKAYDQALLNRKLSYQAVENAVNGKAIGPATKTVLRTFIQRFTPIKLAHEAVDLDLGAFWNVEITDFSRGGADIGGDFQLFAQSNVIPEYIWTGRVSFHYNYEVDNQRIFVDFEARRPPLGSVGDKIYNSDGFATPCGSHTFYALLRSQFEVGDESGVLCIIESRNRTHQQKFDRLLVHAVQFEPEEKNICIVNGYY